MIAIRPRRASDVVAPQHQTPHAPPFVQERQLGYGQASLDVVRTPSGAHESAAARAAASVYVASGLQS